MADNYYDPLERVRRSTAQVVERAELVSWDTARLADLATGFDPAQIRRRYDFDEDYHFVSSSEQAGQILQLNYVFSLDALNFGSGLSPAWKRLEAAYLVQGSLYKTVADTLRREILSHSPLDPTWAANVTVAELAALFGIPPDFELMPMFAASLNQLGRWVVEQYGGSYSNLLEATRADDDGRPSAARLVELLTSNLSLFDDRAEYQGQSVYFYKRAQILANDLYLAFRPLAGGNIGADFDDISRLTIFADNLLPHYFRMAGVLEYDPALADQIERGEPLTAGGQAEVEIRAFGVQCVERLCQWLNAALKPAEPPLFPAQLDVYLWNYSQSPQVKARPRHRTVTYFY